MADGTTGSGRVIASPRRVNTGGAAPGAEDIVVVGTGMVGLNQLTPEADQALRKCSAIYTLHHDPFVMDLLRSRYGGVVPLDGCYAGGKLRMDTYSEVADTVLDAAAGSAPVAFLTYGHPRTFVTPTQLIIDRAVDRGLRVRVLPGVSALDTLLIDLQLDPGERGLQVYGANDVMVNGKTIAPDVPCLIWQVGAVGTVTFENQQMTSPQKVAMLTGCLRRFYPAGHPVVVARSAYTPLASARLVRTTLQALPDLGDRLQRADTLYLPPVA